MTDHKSAFSPIFVKNTFPVIYAFRDFLCLGYTVLVPKTCLQCHLPYFARYLPQFGGYLPEFAQRARFGGCSRLGYTVSKSGMALSWLSPEAACPGSHERVPALGFLASDTAVEKPGSHANLPAARVCKPGYHRKQPSTAVEKPGAHANLPAARVREPGYHGSRLGYTVLEPGTEPSQLALEAARPGSHERGPALGFLAASAAPAELRHEVP